MKYCISQYCVSLNFFSTPQNHYFIPFFSYIYHHCPSENCREDEAGELCFWTPNCLQGLPHSWGLGERIFPRFSYLSLSPYLICSDVLLYLFYFIEKQPNSHSQKEAFSTPCSADLQHLSCLLLVTFRQLVEETAEYPHFTYRSLGSCQTASDDKFKQEKWEI